MDFAALRRWWPLAAVLGLLFVIALAATRSEPQLDQIRPESTVTTRPPLLPSRPTAEPSARAVPEPAQGLPDWVGTATLAVLGAGALLMVIGLCWALIRDYLRRRPARTGRRGESRRPQRTAEDLVAALDAGLEELSDTDRDPRRAVIACWVRLEDAAAAAGTPRHPGDSPTDYVGRLLAEQRVDAGVLAALLAVYREARYATHTVDDRMRQQARSALERLRADLDASRAEAFVRSEVQS
ncbi:DUF4129 domain-containing protein [Actinoplanes utahensis]|uniref:Protein-glutamine gamma-glutamyltransferase-like C-terminal domain-containing protein n=1 Tax=Actinoplanes utahensis TaxID=1869 RepID=A0A0A6UVP7_ACTUT|nr:DUF4129 domain-containing protein [Actinoplanes utahensis]KHD78988.1 hypothetical protein MB27_02630 [Actinoplanes utahensis]GIF28022.1 hypothetical protein Aut01nite_10080 [Actinoplanes utahensis]